MTRAEIVEARDQFIREHGPWTGHRIHLGHGVYTCEDNPAYCLDYRMGLHLQALEDADLAVIRDIRDLSGVRILDLGCHEGAFAIEFAKRGADVVGIDARASNIEHAHFAASVIGLDDQMAPLGCCRFQVLDVRSLLSLEHFDVVLCAGILYHLTASDAVSVMRQISATGCSLAIIDTHVAPEVVGPQFVRQLGDMTEVTVDDETYHGRWYSEFPNGLSTAQKEAYSSGSAIDNDCSFWFTPADLFSLVESCGFEVDELVRKEDWLVMAAWR